ncbi:MAG: SNF2-related protein [Elusimicrobia bacterium]|nr:SNF2-related protein [Elusimicrobiota bacterium]
MEHEPFGSSDVMSYANDHKGAGAIVAMNGQKTEEVAIDPFCVENNLRVWASSRIIARGRAYYRQGHVMSVESFNDNSIEARVEGTRQEPYRVEIKFDKWGMPVSKCDCPFDWEPLCKHAVAVLIAWQQQETGSEPVLSSISAEQASLPTDTAGRDKYLEELAAIEKEDRRARCAEQGIRIVKKPVGESLGVYMVSSADQNCKGKSYRVVLRDEKWEHVSCDCPDFLKNELGTCKHIEIVKRYFKKNRSARISLELAGRQTRRISLYTRARESHNRIYSPYEEIRVHIPPAALGRVNPAIYQYLDGDGYLRNIPNPASKKAYFDKLLKDLNSSLKNSAKVDIDSMVCDILREENDAFKWEKLIDKIAKSPGKHRAWRESVGKMDIALHPYQKEGILFAVKKRRAFIGDDMGLGKTMQAIGAAFLLKEMGHVRRTVVIAPASLKFQWKREIEKVTKLPAVIISGSARERNEQYRKCGGFFIILNYELLYRDLDRILNLKPDMVILDEAQRIKNWETKIAQNIKKLESPFRLVLTGTPLQNRLPELHSISEFLHPKALGANWKLVPTYAHLDENDKIAGYSHLNHLRKRLDKFFIRRSRESVLSQLPKRTDNNFWIGLTPQQQETHDELAKNINKLMSKMQKYKRLTREDMQRLFMILTCMRIVSNAYGQYDWKSIELEVLTAKHASSALMKTIGSPKLEEFRKIMADLLETPGQKVVVFSQWKRMIRLADICIRENLESVGGSSVIFCGGLSLKKREAEIKRFIEDPSARVFFSTDAGGVGLNLQHAANCVINLEVPWNPAVLEQRVARVHRMGQKKSVQVINLISSESIEERIFNLIAQKKALFSGLFDTEVKDIRFNAVQSASFIDKIKMIVPGSTAVDSEDEEEDELETDVEDGLAITEQSTEKPVETAQTLDTVAEVNIPTHGHADAPPAAVEIDIGPAVAAFSKMLNLSAKAPSASTGLPAAPIVAAQTGGMKLKISEDKDGMHLCLPKQATELLKGLRPVLETLLKLGR